ncbi:hypothetical protein [Pantoea sp. SOD02]|uniref:hypothetical protein n=1 Tax=Pantoea sp. SOD02 TaxID=2970818 RepID=UPI0021587481|nr:hypothetical protein [Pantoea sp. SOD02]UVC28807.1 hypothetical protein NR302_16425 [Pantoea sp. SOD02]
MSKYIFDKIHESASLQDPMYTSDDHARWLVRKDQADIDIMSDAEVKFILLGVNKLVATIKYENENYFCFSGLGEAVNLPANLEEIESTPGLFACVIYCAQLKSFATASQARDALEQQYRGVDEYSGHALEQIEDLFQKLYFAKANIDASSTYLNNLDRVAGAYIASQYLSHPLEINYNLRSRLITFFEAGDETIPFNLPLQGILSYNWPSLFLDLYRCLEQLYTVIKLKSLVEKLPYNGALAELAYLLEDQLSWRPKEQDALASILSSSNEATRSKVISAFNPDTQSGMEYSASKCAAHIYKLRNSHVHFRPAMKAETRSTEQWNEIVIAMCDMVDEVYEALGNEFLKNRVSS